MNYFNTLERVWQQSGREKSLKVRFHDWSHQIKYFEILGESEDGKRLVGKLDNGEKISFSKKSKGWDIYWARDEYQQAHAV